RLDRSSSYFWTATSIGGAEPLGMGDMGSNGWVILGGHVSAHRVFARSYRCSRAHQRTEPRLSQAPRPTAEPRVDWGPTRSGGMNFRTSKWRPVPLSSR